MESIEAQPTCGRNVILKATADYDNWTEIIQARLEVAKVWNDVDPEKSTSREATLEEEAPTIGLKQDLAKVTEEIEKVQKEATACRRKVKDIILSTISLEQQQHIKKMKDLKEIQKALNKVHSRPNKEKLFNALIELTARKIPVEKTIEERASKLKTLNTEVGDYKKELKLHDEVPIALLINSLLSDYLMTVQIMKQNGHMDDLNTVVQILKGEEERLKGNCHRALTTTYNSRPQERLHERMLDRLQYVLKKGIGPTCYRCSRQSHIAKDCLNAFSQSNPTMGGRSLNSLGNPNRGGTWGRSSRSGRSCGRGGCPYARLAECEEREEYSLGLFYMPIKRINQLK